MFSIPVAVDIPEYTRYLTYFLSQSTRGAHPPVTDPTIEAEWGTLCGSGLPGLHILIDSVGRTTESQIDRFEKAMILSVVMASRGNAQDNAPWYALYQNDPGQILAVGIELTASPLRGYARFVYHFCQTVADAATIEGFPLVYIRLFAASDMMEVELYKQEQARARQVVDVNINTTNFDGIHPTPEQYAAVNRALADTLDGQISMREAGRQPAQATPTTPPYVYNPYPLLTPNSQAETLDWDKVCGTSSERVENVKSPARQSGRRLKRTKPTTPKEESNDVTHNFDQSSKDPVNQRFARRARRTEQARHSDDFS